jgi:hypothetical protein
MHVGPVFFLSLFPTALLAQGQASLGIGVGTVRHSGGTSFAAVSLSPAVHLLRPSLYAGGAGSLSLIEEGVWAGQSRADLWAAFTRGPRVRFAANASASITTRSDGDAAGVGSVLGEAVYAGREGAGVALGIGPVLGVLEREPGIGAVRVRARAWRQAGESPLQLSLAIESTRFLGAWFSDVVSGASFENARLSASAWASARLSRAYGSTGAVSASVQYFATRSIAVEVAGGSYLRDPFQALPRAAFGSVGIRIHAVPRPNAPVEADTSPQLTPLVAQRVGAGDTVVVRFRMDAERSVAIAGDWNGWTPVPLRALGDDIWEAALVLPTGTYHFNLFVDETEWVVPGGVAVVPDGMGGLVALLTVL